MRCHQQVGRGARDGFEPALAAMVDPGQGFHEGQGVRVARVIV